MKKLKFKIGQPYPLGASVIDGGINFSMVNDSNKECGVILYRRGTELKERILFDKNYSIGNVFCIFIEGIADGNYEYNFFIGDKVLVDPYAKRIVGNEKWKSGEFKRPFLRGGFYNNAFDWQGTRPLHIPYNESIMYCLNVRSFTKHSSSKVKNRGTFDGLIEKLPYLKDLGINGIELMPAYEFEECEWDNIERISIMHTIEYQVEHINANIEENPDTEKARRLNCWGYKEAFYFAPKDSYAAGTNASEEFKRMVREFHKNGIEIIMQFYFPSNIKPGYILEILKYWVLEYRIDGFHLKGEKVPVTLIATEPVFANTKIMCDDFRLGDIYPESEIPRYRNLGYYRDEFMYDMRRYLKGDQNMLQNFQYHMRNYNPRCGVVNFVANYYGFTLVDLVSYDAKHNEANGEENSDGTDFNCSWNCGMEGPSRKKAINELRHKQMKNILSFLFMAQGTPLLYAGDEFGNSQHGNNNCYCQDNETGWVDWRGLTKNVDIYEYVKCLIEFRRAHPMLHLDGSMSMLDKYGYGYPDLSYHGNEAWRVQLGAHDRHIGIMYCGKGTDSAEGDYIYIACNMHWNSHRFALPSIANYEWVKAIETSENALVTDYEQNTCYIDIKPRSITVLTGKRLPLPEKKIKTVRQSRKKDK